MGGARNRSNTLGVPPEELASCIGVIQKQGFQELEPMEQVGFGQCGRCQGGIEFREELPIAQPRRYIRRPRQ